MRAKKIVLNLLRAALLIASVDAGIDPALADMRGEEGFRGDLVESANEAAVPGKRTTSVLKSTDTSASSPVRIGATEPDWIAATTAAAEFLPSVDDCRYGAGCIGNAALGASGAWSPYRFG